MHTRDLSAFQPTDTLPPNPRHTSLDAACTAWLAARGLNETPAERTARRWKIGKARKAARLAGKDV